MDRCKLADAATDSATHAHVASPVVHTLPSSSTSAAHSNVLAGTTTTKRSHAYVGIALAKNHHNEGVINIILHIRRGLKLAGTYHHIHYYHHHSRISSLLHQHIKGRGHTGMATCCDPMINQTMKCLYHEGRSRCVGGPSTPHNVLLDVTTPSDDAAVMAAKDAGTTTGVWPLTSPRGNNIVGVRCPRLSPLSGGKWLPPPKDFGVALACTMRNMAQPPSRATTSHKQQPPEPGRTRSGTAFEAPRARSDAVSTMSRPGWPESTRSGPRSPEPTLEVSSTTSQLVDNHSQDKSDEEDPQGDIKRLLTKRKWI